MQMHSNYAALSIFSVLLGAGEAVNLRASSRAQVDSEFFAYDYSKHGLDWKQGECTSEVRQSPINLPASARVRGKFRYKYNPITEPFDLLNNGKTLAADFAGQGFGGLTYQDEWYELMNVNVHSLSEHAWNGIKYPLELHLVHKHFSTDSLVIVAIPLASANPPHITTPPPFFLQLNESFSDDRVHERVHNLPQAPFAANYVPPLPQEPGFNAELQMFLELPPPPVNMRNIVPKDPYNPFDLNKLLAGGTFFEYAGSLTAPPCAEIATWLVRDTPLNAADKQIKYLYESIYSMTADFGNYRALMPVAGRSIFKLQATVEDYPAVPHPPIPLAEHGQPQQADREFRAMKWAMDAMTIAKASTNYIKDLDTRVRAAAQAHADALVPQLGEYAIITTTGAPGYGQPPINMEAAAQTMSRTLAEAARAEVGSATEEISKVAKEVAMKAALHSAHIVYTGIGNQSALADYVPDVANMPWGIATTPVPQPGAAAAGAAAVTPGNLLLQSPTTQAHAAGASVSVGGGAAAPATGQAFLQFGFGSYGESEDTTATLTLAVAVGATSLPVDNIAAFKTGDAIQIDAGQPTAESLVLTGVSDGAAAPAPAPAAAGGDAPK